MAADSDAGWPLDFRTTNRSVAVEFDTFADTFDPPDFNDQNWIHSEDHIAVVVQGSFGHSGLPYIMAGNLEDDLVHGASIQWGGAGHMLEVWMRHPNNAWEKTLSTDTADLVKSYLGTTTVVYGFMGIVGDDPDYNVQYVMP